MAKRVTEAEKTEMRSLRNQDLSYTEITKLTGRCKNVISYHTDEHVKSRAKCYADKYNNKKDVKEKRQKKEQIMLNLGFHIFNLLDESKNSLNLLEIKRGLEDKFDIKFSEDLEDKIGYIVSSFRSLGPDSIYICSEDQKYKVNRNSPYYAAYAGKSD
ncbi:MAG: hypothetical protein NTY99_01185 [DPANN group archaeon]|nr:hypothetical protein [DPANN group archaeon]